MVIFLKFVVYVCLWYMYVEVQRMRVSSFDQTPGTKRVTKYIDHFHVVIIVPGHL
jgi:hypothetical protein